MSGKKLEVKLPDRDGQASFKVSRGGARPGGGRKSLKEKNLVQRKVSIALPPELWKFIDQVKEQRPQDSQSDILRTLLRSAIRERMRNNHLEED